MNKYENAASGKAMDSLINYETVKIFCNEKHEADRFDESLASFQVRHNLNKANNSIIPLIAVLYL
jgi:ATP-binding cassette subfamily B protein